MAQGRKEDTALGVARARFVEGLPRKASELKGAVALLAATPDNDRPREEMRRRLHALYASAQVFRIEALAGALREAIQRLDAAREQQRGLRQDDLDALATLAATLPVLGGSESASGPSAPVPPVRASAPVPPRPPPSAAPAALRNPVSTGNTIRGMQPVSEPPGPPPAVISGSVAAAGAALGQTQRRPSGTFTAGRASEPPAPMRISSMPGEAAQAMPVTVVSVLVLDGVESQAQIRAALPAERFEVLSASDPEEALRIARSSAPDVVLADRGIALRPGVDFISRLRSDPLTDFVPVVLLLPPGTPHDPMAVRDAGADEALAKPVDPAVLIKTVARATGTGADGDSSLIGLGEMNVSEVSDRIAYEIRRGLVDSVEAGRLLKIPMGDGAEVLAAAWAAVARVRQQLVHRSGGRVRFRDVPRRGGPAVLALVGELDQGGAGDTTAPSDAETTLAYRRIIVADDDPAVVWFFAGLLREAGAEVIEANDGLEALDEARAVRPDLIVSDILMPRMDGFALCRELTRDPSLQDVPVILLSWKEDLLQRMRELQAGATGYLRKEAGSAQILARVREALRPLSRLEAQLRTGGEVRGRIEGLGIVPLLRTVARERPDARITIRDAWNLFEVDCRAGNLVHLTRTATDGSFSRGEAALPQFLGITAGRFTVVASESPVRGAFKTDLDETLRRGARKLGAVLDTISGTGLVQVARVEFEEDVVASVVRTSPDRVRELVKQLTDGASPREMILGGKVGAPELEAELVDLARRGALRGVYGPNGEDRIADALKVREAAPAPVLATTRPPPTETDEDEPEQAPPPRIPISQPPKIAMPEAEPEIVAAPPSPVAGPAPAPAEVPDLPRPQLPHEIASEPPTRAETEAKEREAEPVLLVRPSAPPATAAPGTAEPGTAEPGLAEPGKKDADLAVFDDLAALAPPPRPAGDIPELDDLAPLAPPPAGDAPVKTPARVADDTPSRATIKEPDPVPAPRPDAAARAETQPQEIEGPGISGWIFLAVILAALGFIGYRLITAGGDGAVAPQGELRPPPTVGDGTGQLVPSKVVPRLPTPPLPPGPTPPSPPANEDQFGFGRLEPGIEPTPDVTVTPDQGLLVVEGAQSGPEARVLVDDRDLGVSPLRVPLSEGPHVVSFRRGDETRHRRILIKRGYTRVVPVP